MLELIYIEGDKVAFDPNQIESIAARGEGSQVVLRTGTFFNLKKPFDDVLQAVLDWQEARRRAQN